MISKSEKQLMQTISNLSKKWFDDTVGKGCVIPNIPAENSNRRKKRSAKDDAATFLQMLERSVVNDVLKAFGLKHCELILPLKSKAALAQ